MLPRYSKSLFSIVPHSSSNTSWQSEYVCLSMPPLRVAYRRLKNCSQGHYGVTAAHSLSSLIVSWGFLPTCLARNFLVLGVVNIGLPGLESGPVMHDCPSWKHFLTCCTVLKIMLVFRNLRKVLTFLEQRDHLPSFIMISFNVCHVLKALAAHLSP